MKKFIAGLAAGLVIAVPSTAIARQVMTNDGFPDVNDIYQFNCKGNYARGHQCNHVAVFDDQDNKCYVTYDSNGAQSSISCVKDN